MQVMGKLESALLKKYSYQSYSYLIITLTLNSGLNLFGKTLPPTLRMRSLPPEKFRAAIACLPSHSLLPKPK